MNTSILPEKGKTNCGIWTQTVIPVIARALGVISKMFLMTVGTGDSE